MATSDANDNSSTTPRAAAGMNVEREMLKLLRLASNRRCADCDAELTDHRSLWADVEAGCFVCASCLTVHKGLAGGGGGGAGSTSGDGPCPRAKSVTRDAWTEDEVRRMQAMGNGKVNEVLERYVPASWAKPAPDAEAPVRELWIRAKYEQHYFMLPHYGDGGDDGSSVTGYQRPTSMSQTLPMRLVDYFAIVGLGPLQVDALPGPNARPDEITFKARVLDCFPDADSHLGCPLPEHVPQFIFPEGGVRLPGTDAPPTLFHFVLTNVSGVRMYGVALRVTEELAAPDLRWAVRAGLEEAAAAAELSAGRKAGSGGSSNGGSGDAATRLSGGFGSGHRRSRAGGGGATAAAAAAAASGLLPTWLRTFVDAEPPGPNVNGNVNNAAAPAAAAGTAEAEMCPVGAEYVPKAMVLLSHYPFYNVYAQFLQQLYRISLSEAPLPIERYISNFVCEVPLPPQGQFEVVYALPDRTLAIKRPPRNRLPLVDFSYRPLFACLSVENVLTLYGLLMCEAKMALLSSRTALLNPVAEGLLSLLFPLVWQGAYIPVMPLAMADVLDAPVPFLVGLSSTYLRDVPPERRPNGVVLVDLDNDVIHLGTDDAGRARRRPHMPERETHKLKQKLQEFAAVAYQRRSSSSSSNNSANAFYAAPLGSSSNTATGAGAGSSPTGSSVTSGAGGSGSGGGGNNSSAAVAGGGRRLLNPAWALDKADLAFPNSEHLLPLSRFATEQGLTVPTNARGGAAAASGKAGSSSSGGKTASAWAAGGQRRRRVAAVSQAMGMTQGPSAAAVSAAAGGRNSIASELGDVEGVSLLDPRNNSGMRDGFNANEIRAAFLRWSVSTFRSYQNFVVTPTNDDPLPERLFDRAGFLKDSGHLPDHCHEFLAQVTQSQMFERFLEERVMHPKQPEIRFFDESILAKLNRSKTNPIKRETPFLSDTSDAHTQTFTPPPPSNWGLPDDGTSYTYPTGFPRLSKDRCGTVRWAQRLFKTPDQHRNVSGQNHQELLRQRRRRLVGRRDSAAAAAAAAAAGGAAAAAAAAGGLDMPQRARAASLQGRVPAARVMAGVVAVQAGWRAHSARNAFLRRRDAASTVARARRNRLATAADRAALARALSSAMDIQRVWRGRSARRHAAERRHAAVKLQAWWRMAAVRKRFRRARRAAVLLAAAARGRHCRAAYQVVRQLIILVQATVRGWFKRRVAARERAKRLEELRSQLLQLWELAYSPLLHRSKFWVVFQGNGFLDLAIHEDEALRLWRDLGLVAHNQEHLARARFNAAFAGVEQWLKERRKGKSPTAKGSGLSGNGVIAKAWRRGGGNGAAALPAAGGAAAATSTSSWQPRPHSTGKNRSALAVLGLRRSSVEARAAAAAVRGGMPADGGGGTGTTAALSGTGGSSSSARMTAAADVSGGGGSGLDGAAERLQQEREALYLELKRDVNEGIRASLFQLFGLAKQKKRKRKLVGLLWKDPACADASAEVVLSVFKDRAEARHAWVQNRRDLRVRADLLCTVQACIVSIQGLRAALDATGKPTLQLPLPPAAGSSSGGSVGLQQQRAEKSDGGGGRWEAVDALTQQAVASLSGQEPAKRQVIAAAAAAAAAAPLTVATARNWRQDAAVDVDVDPAALEDGSGSVGGHWEGPTGNSSKLLPAATCNGATAATGNGHKTVNGGTRSSNAAASSVSGVDAAVRRPPQLPPR